MSVDLSGEITAIATAVLAVGAIVAGIVAYLAFRKQSQEVHAIERQVKDQEELSRQQAELLKVQSGQLEVQRQQLADQREERRRAQARRIFISAEPRPDPNTSPSTDPIRETFASVTNTSPQPIYDLRFLFREGDASGPCHPIRPTRRSSCQATGTTTPSPSTLGTWISCRTLP